MSTQTTEYLVRVRDLASAGFGRIQSAGTTAFNRLAASMSTTQSRLNTLPQSVSQLNARLNELTRMREVSIDRRQIRQLDAEISQVERRLNGLQRPTGGGGLGAMIPGGGLALAAGAGLGIGGIMSGIIEDEMNLVSLEVLTKSKDTAVQMQQQLKQYALETPYQSGNLVNQAATLKSFGVSTQNVIPTLKMLGDVARGDENRLNSLTLAFAQMSAAGKLSGQDLLQMVNAGFNPLSIISEKTGKSMSDLRKEMEQGAISSIDVAEAFKIATSEGGDFFGMADKMNESFGGQWNAFKESAMEAGKSIMKDLMPPLTWLLQTATGLLQYKEVIMSVGLGWLVYKQITDANSISQRLLASTLFTVRGALIATGIGAIAVVIGMLWNLYERVKQTKNGVEVLKQGLIGFGTAVKTTFQIMAENITFVLEKTWIRVKTFFGNLIDKPLQLIKAVGLFATGNFAGAAAAMKGMFSSESGDKALAELEGRHNKRLADLKGQRTEAWAKTKTSFGTLYGSSAASGDGALNLNDFNGNGNGEGLGSAADKAARATGAGARSIVINIGKFQDAINIYTATAGEALDDMDRRITETLLRVVNSGALIQ